jgi:hypothetical protein
MAYDAAREQVVVFSGVSTAADTWTWDGGSWTLRQPAMSPPHRAFGGLAGDSGRDMVVLFGGVDGTTYFDDTWTWNGTTWTAVTAATHPSARQQPSMAYDPKRGVVVLFGGSASPMTALGDTWEFDGTTWTQKATSGVSARFGAAMTWDPATERIVIAGGEGAGATSPDDAYAWDGTAWTVTNDPGNVLEGSLLATDSARGYVVMFDTAGALYEHVAAVSWTQSTPGSYSSAVLPDRSAHIAVADAARAQIVVFGGTSGDTDPGVADPPRGDTWVWNGQWKQVSASGPAAARIGAAAAYDSVRKQVVMFGGCTDVNTAAFGDMWTFNGTTWTSRTGTLPPARCFAHMAFDTKAGRIVLQGGENLLNVMSDTWTWDGQSWHQETPSLPGPLASAAAVAYDEDRGRVVLFGGRHWLGSPGSADAILHNDTYEWDGTTWSRPTVAGPPPPRMGAGAAWDRARHRIVMFGGKNSFGESDTDVYEWVVAPTGGRWELGTAAEAGGLEFSAMTPALDGAGVVAVAGRLATAETNANGDVLSMSDVWRLRWDGSSAAERCSGTDSDADGKVDCDDPDCEVACATCGDGMCDPLELCTSCPADCGACADTCGDLVCRMDETCAGDCP